MQNHKDLDCQTLMAKFQAQLDNGVFEIIIARYSGPALAVARKYLRDAGLAEDAVQSTFLKVIRKRHTYNALRPFSSWFYTILRNVCLDMIRRQSLHQQALSKLIEQNEPLDDKSQPGMDLGILEQLPDGERAVIELRIIHDLGFRDIATALGISREAAKKRAQRGLRRLRENISAQDRDSYLMGVMD
ncbi:MAG: sigma-70 family RNA polymerase sigma factor [Sedimentisphaerales bacterium]|nr:sigma-70 family RNA polymerase sigma factor [Sedimentisphaerales bacterium]